MNAGPGSLSQVRCNARVPRFKAPHPNAAKVFVNWFLSREGQRTLQKALAEAKVR